MPICPLVAYRLTASAADELQRRFPAGPYRVVEDATFIRIDAGAMNTIGDPDHEKDGQTLVDDDLTDMTTAGAEEVRATFCLWAAAPTLYGEARQTAALLVEALPRIASLLPDVAAVLRQRIAALEGAVDGADRGPILFQGDVGEDPGALRARVAAQSAGCEFIEPPAA